jgi:hypothetical protein
MHQPCGVMAVVPMLALAVPTPGMYSPQLRAAVPAWSERGCEMSADRLAMRQEGVTTIITVDGELAVTCSEGGQRTTLVLRNPEIRSSPVDTAEEPGFTITAERIEAR